MPESHRLEVGETVAIRKQTLGGVLSNLKDAGYEVLGPQVKDSTVVYAPLEGMAQLPQGMVTQQEPGRFRLKAAEHAHYFDFIPAAQSWKQFLFPPRLEIMKLRKLEGTWVLDDLETRSPAYAFIGVRACELAAIQVQDRAFLREDFTDPVYKARREKVFILAVNCTHPASTCFCGSMDSGPRVQPGFDLCLTELDDVDLLQIGSELGRRMAAGMAFEPASAFLLGMADRSVDEARRQTSGAVDGTRCEEAIRANLEDDYWQEVSLRCLSCGNCTLVCPTCFCWDAVDQANLTGTETRRERMWDSCFNPAYSYLAGGNTRPTIRARYRQWLSHKFAAWRQQYGVQGCIGCGRCITWCPAKIDTRLSLAELARKRN